MKEKIMYNITWYAIDFDEENPSWNERDKIVAKDKAAVIRYFQGKPSYRGSIPKPENIREVCELNMEQEKSLFLDSIFSGKKLALFSHREGVFTLEDSVEEKIN